MAAENSNGRIPKWAVGAVITVLSGACVLLFGLLAFLGKWQIDETSRLRDKIGGIETSMTALEGRLATQAEILKRVEEKLP